MTKKPAVVFHVRPQPGGAWLVYRFRSSNADGSVLSDRLIEASTPRRARAVATGLRLARATWRSGRPSRLVVFTRTGEQALARTFAAILTYRVALDPASRRKGADTWWRLTNPHGTYGLHGTQGEAVSEGRRRARTRWTDYHQPAQLMVHSHRGNRFRIEASYGADRRDRKG